MKLEFYNCPKPQEMEEVKLLEKPLFLSYEPDFELIQKLSEKYKQYQNILVIGHGGSITSFYGIYHALEYQTKKQAYFLSTVDPDYIYELKNKLNPENTLVIAISKSGEDTTQLEAFAQFINYPLLIITSKNTPLKAIAEKLKTEVIIHPPIGGRYTGLTEVALLPAGLCGINIKSLYQGAKEFYDLYQQDNLAFKAASIFWQLEKMNFIDVFVPFYSHNLFYMSNLIVQLCHESFGKDNKGQTYITSEAPESQHHTNQRFFGGKRNICGFFISCENFMHSMVNNYPPEIHSIQIKGNVLFDLNKIPLEKSMEFELIGTLENAKINSIPIAHLAINDFNPKEIGRFIAFWQLYAVYASVLRNVDPFNQPQVENSKNISFNKRLNFKGLL